MIMNEDERQAFHFFTGASCIALLLVFGVEVSAYLCGVSLVLGLALLHLKLFGHKIWHFEWFLARFERPGVLFGYGAITLAAGVLAILTLLPSQGQMLASLVILGFGDAASTVVGTRCRQKLPYNQKKTIGGSAAFFVACLPAVLFAGWGAMLVALAAAIAEGLESGVDDNLLVSIVCVICFTLIGA